MNGKVILITGAAGTGKSTLVRMILETVEPFKRVDYGQLLIEHKARSEGASITYDELRRDSGAVIAASDVRAVDEWLIQNVPEWRSQGNVIIDSHAVTKESFGFRITPYSLDQVRRIGFDAILVLVGEPSTLAHRISADTRGRPVIDVFQAGFQVQLQPSLAVLYAVTCGQPCFAVENNANGPRDRSCCRARPSFPCWSEF